MTFLDELAARRRFGMKPGLGAIRRLAAALGDPHERLRGVIHLAGTNGKGATAAILDACLRAAGRRVARYTSPHLVQLNERFFLDGAPLGDGPLERAAERVAAAARRDPALNDLTFFEALTATAFVAFADAEADCNVFETGLGGRLDATNIVRPRLTVITRLGLDHCDWLGDTIEQIAAEKAGIIKAGVPVVLGRNVDAVRRVVEARARDVGAPFHYAPDLATAADVPRDFALKGAFNRENAVTALAALKLLLDERELAAARAGFAQVVWPGRFQTVGRYLIDGAHNPPAARALADALAEAYGAGAQFRLIAGFCGDKDIDETLRILAPFVTDARAVPTSNPRALAPERLAAKMRAAGIDAVPCASLAAALAGEDAAAAAGRPDTLICGSLFLAGDALVALGAVPWSTARRDPSELLAAAPGRRAD